MNVSTLSKIVARGVALTAADCDRVIHAAPYCSIAGVPASHRWIEGARAEWRQAQQIARRAVDTGQPWTPLFATRVDLVGHFGPPGPDEVGCRRKWVRGEDDEASGEALAAWAKAGYAITIGDGRHDSREWLIEWARFSQRLGWSSCYVQPDEAAHTIYLQSLGLDLANHDCRIYLRDRLRLTLYAIRDVLGIPGAGLLVPIKTGQLCTPGYTTLPGVIPPGLDRMPTGPRYLLGGHWSLAGLGSFYRDIFAGLPTGSVVTGETPYALRRGALWAGNPPPQVAGDGVFV